MKCKFDVSLYNICVLGISFMLLFSAYNGTQLSVPSVIYSIKAESNGTFAGDGYISLCIVYAVAFCCHFLGPVVVACLGPKVSMFSTGLLYCLFIASFLKPMVWSLYLGSALVGLGAPILWNAHNTLLTVNSDVDTLGRNVGLYIALFNLSGVFGNIYSTYVLGGSAVITPGERTRLFIGFSGTGLLGVLCLLLLKKPSQKTLKLQSENEIVEQDGMLTETSDDRLMRGFPQQTSENPAIEQTGETDNLQTHSNLSQENPKPLYNLKRCFQLLKTKEILLLSFLALYQGFEVSFTGVYATCLANNRWFGEDSKGLIGASGIASSIGLIIGAIVFSWYGKHAVKYGRDPVVVLGYLMQTVTYYVIFLNQQESCPTQESRGPTYIPSNKYVAVICSFTFGLGGSCFQTQFTSLVGHLYHENSSPAFSAVSLFGGIAAASAFFYSKYLQLHWHLIILITTSTVGVLCFCLVEWTCTKAVRQGYHSVQTDDMDMDEMSLE